MFLSVFDDKILRCYVVLNLKIKLESSRETVTFLYKTFFRRLHTFEHIKI